MWLIHQLVAFWYLPSYSEIPSLRALSHFASVFQGAGAATCAWLCWRTKPPYTSKTRAPPLSDNTVVDSTPFRHQDPTPNWNVRPPLSPELEARSWCSWAGLQISFRSLSYLQRPKGEGGTEPKQTSDQQPRGSNRHYQPACRVPEGCRQTAWTHTFSWTVTHQIPETQRIQ